MDFYKRRNICQIVEDVLRSLVRRGDEEALTIAIELADYCFFNKGQPRSCDEGLLFELLTTKNYYNRNYHTSVGYHWHSVAEGFRTRFPSRDIDLLSSILSKVIDSAIFSQSDYQSKIANAIIHAHPDEAWIVVSNILESTMQGSWRIVIWLGDDFGFDDDNQSTPIGAFKPENIMFWVMQNPKLRAKKIAGCLPKTLDEKRGGKLSRLFLEAFGDDDLGNDLMGHFFTGVWSGPESLGSVFEKT